MMAAERRKNVLEAFDQLEVLEITAEALTNSQP
jgi:hypothetical protein